MDQIVCKARLPRGIQVSLAAMSIHVCLSGLWWDGLLYLSVF